MILKIAIGAYGGLSLLAAVLQGKYNNIPKGSAVLMGIGGLLMLMTLFVTDTLSILTLVAGVILAHVSAVINGVKMYGKVNKSHHFARFIISALLVGAHVTALGIL